MNNYYERDSEGLWWINGKTTKVKCSFSGSMEIAYQMGKKSQQQCDIQTGRKEVVDWINDNTFIVDNSNGDDTPTYDIGDWQKQLKEWGLE